jgi:uncharacterized protein (DUF362 family)
MPSSGFENFENIVALSRTPAGVGYEYAGPELFAPELPRVCAPTTALRAVRQLLEHWGLDRANQGTTRWNPLGEFIPPASKIAIKPNWVHHAPRGPASLDALITHTSVIQAVLEYVALTRPRVIMIGDAPLQSCDFGALYKAASLGALEHWGRERGLTLSIADFRRTINPGGRTAGGERQSDVRALDQFVLFDLGEDSALGPLDSDSERFRVTVYDPDLLTAAHRQGSHKYLIAREVLEADVVLNIPKLKCHTKACITGTLKNLVGINGHKEYLPHHRKGGSSAGGDCYPGAPQWKRVMEDAADIANHEGGLRPLRYALGRTVAAGRKLAALACADTNIEGAWHGNDTLWRTCVDLNHILMYGRTDGRLHSDSRRTIISITDAVVAGEGEGPLKPTPVAAGFLTGARNAAAAEYVHARLMGFDPNRIPLIRGAFATSKWPLVTFSPDEIRLRGGSDEVAGPQVAPVRSFVPPSGWRGQCELKNQNVPLEVHLASV